ncbi:MAG: twitch domain-containing radical SAM protein [Bdellovibrionia bacterium]
MSDSEKLQEEIKSSKVFCILPWVHMNLLPSGKVMPCCFSDRSQPLGNVGQSTLKEIWNGKEMKALRRNMLNGVPTAGCTRCYELDETGATSYRQIQNQNYRHHLERPAKTGADGFYSNYNVPYLNLRFSNKCNLRCRSCDSDYSTGWYLDAKALGRRVPSRVITPIPKGVSLTEQLDPLLDEVEQIHFAGGEPLLLDEHYDLLSRLRAKKLFKVQLTYNTNFSKLKYKSFSVLDFWKDFENVKVNASFDGQGPRGEYLRKGLVWEEAVANRKLMQAEVPHVKFGLAPTLSILNALHLPDLHREWVESGMLDIENFTINPLASPSYYRAQILPVALKDRMRKLYEDHIESFIATRRPRNSKVEKAFKAALSFTMAKNRPDLLPAFLRVTREIDRLRNENFIEVFPELAPLYLSLERPSVSELSESP